MTKLRRLRLKSQAYMHWIAAAVTLHTLHWSAETLFEGFDRPAHGEPFLSWHLLWVGLFLASAVWLYRVRHEFQPHTRQVRDIDVPERRPCLILFLSELDTNNQAFKDGVPSWFEPQFTIKADIKTLEDLKGADRSHKWIWEMPLRGIRHHLPKLKTIVMVCSPESIRQVHWFRAIVAEYAEFRGIELLLLTKQADGASLIACPTQSDHQFKGWQFERFDELSQALLGAIRLCDYSDTGIMVDFTGGQKVTSVVAAAVTFNRRIEAQYVQTNKPWGVVGYDLMLRAAEIEGKFEL